MKDILNWVIISDLHCGSREGLFPITGAMLDEGIKVQPSPIHKKIWKCWREFWDDWVPRVTRKESFGLIINGDIIDGRHHDATDLITHNLSDQANIAYEVLAPVIERAAGGLYVIRGTEAHVGPSAEEEERLARRLGAIPNELGQYARYDLWKKIGNALIHCLHHIGTTGSAAYETTAIMKELVEEYAEAARWGEKAPDVIVRSHRHRGIKIEIPRYDGYGIAVVTPGWQGKTPYVWRLAGNRLAPAQIGGILIRQGDEEFYTRSITWPLGRSKVER
jgi:hypothetical protein